MRDNASEAPDVSSDQAREMGAELRRRARAWFAYADALDDASPGASDVAAHDASAPANVKGSAASPRTNKRPLIAHLIAERPMPPWLPAEIHRALIDQNLVSPETTSASVRVTLHRMLNGDELARTPRGQYTIPGYEQEGALQ